MGTRPRIRLEERGTTQCMPISLIIFLLRAVRRRINAEFAQNATRTIVVKYDGMVSTRFFLAGKARTEAERGGGRILKAQDVLFGQFVFSLVFLACGPSIVRIPYRRAAMTFQFARFFSFEHLSSSLPPCYQLHMY